MKNHICVLYVLLCNAYLAASESNVSCGGHFASTCAECPQGNGAAWCNGDCTWIDNQCTEYVKKCGGGITRSRCADCPSGESGCADSNAPFDPDGCAWHQSTNLCRDAFSDEVRTASVHLNYQSPINQPAWLFQRVIPTASEDATYFASNGHRFGYGGIQQVNDFTGRVIFSLWDQGGCDQDLGGCDSDDLAQTVACGEGVTCASFGGEGTGRKSYFDTPALPVINEEYFFVTQAAYLGNRRMEYTGYFYFQGSWKLLSRIQVSTNQNEEWWLGGLYNFVEQWSAIDTTKDRAALFGPAFMASTDGDDFTQVSGVSFSHGTLENHEHVNAWQTGSNLNYAVGIETGGDAVQEAQRGQWFTYPSVQVYDELLSFSAKIPCLNAASDKNSIENCLDQPSSTPGPTRVPTLAPTSGPTPGPTPAPFNEPTGSPVSCGGHFASSCAECPQGNGEYWCNGECIWGNNQSTNLITVLSLLFSMNQLTIKSVVVALPVRFYSTLHYH
mmetsp:Transcript_23490/g.35667  ORF Transcript_23490/g.35667 Transcript_23490/m.35667 type:complete len:500 (-) Transcript_23490:113-1612(-)